MDTAEFDDIGFVAYAQTEGHGLKGMGILAGFLILYELVSKASPPFHFQIDDRLLFSESLRHYYDGHADPPYTANPAQLTKSSGWKSRARESRPVEHVKKSNWCRACHRGATCAITTIATLRADRPNFCRRFFRITKD